MSLSTFSASKNRRRSLTRSLVAERQPGAGRQLGTLFLSR
jgi:hypothetical protein